MVNLICMLTKKKNKVIKMMRKWLNTTQFSHSSLGSSESNNQSPKCLQETSILEDLSLMTSRCYDTKAKGQTAAGLGKKLTDTIPHS